MVAAVVSPDVIPANWRDLQKAYEQKRRRWARKVNRPYSCDLDKPDPGEIPIIDSEEG